MTRSPTNPASRERLLEVATEVFADQGFRNSRVREICRRAEANVAAVNYHFGDKQGLYEEVLSRAFSSMTGGDPTDLGVDDDAPPAVRLRAFITGVLAALLDEGRGAGHARLVAREMVDPTDALNRVVDEGIRPQLQTVLPALRELLGPHADSELVRRCASSVVGQCLFYHFGRPAIVQLQLEESLGQEKIEALASHITAFSLAALEQLARQVHTHGERRVSKARTRGGHTRSKS